MGTSEKGRCQRDEIRVGEAEKTVYWGSAGVVETLRLSSELSFFASRAPFLKSETTDGVGES